MQKIIFLCIITAISGCIILNTTSPGIAPNFLEINATISSVSFSDNVLFIRADSSIPIVAFKSLPLRANDSVILVGNLKEYNGRLEFVVDAVR